MSTHRRPGLANVMSSFLSLVVVSCIAIFVPSLSASAAEDPSAVMTTVGGVLRVFNDPDSEPHLVFNKTRVPGVSNDRLALVQKFQVAGNDVVLVQSNCSGSSCSYSTLYLVTITPGGKLSVSDEMEANEGGQADIKKVGDSLSITTETYQGRRKTTHRWIYAAGKVMKSK